jgi:uncharacterized membrane protein
MVAKDPVHLYIGLYDEVETAAHDFEGLVTLHRQGLVAAFDAAVIERGEDGVPRIVHKKRTGHHILTGLGIGALLTVLTPFVAIPFAAIGAGGGALARHAEDSLPKSDAEELGEALAATEAALVVASKKTEPGRLEQMLPTASRRLAIELDLEHADFAEALRQAREET